MELPPQSPPLSQADSVEVTLLLRFEKKRPAQVTGQHIHLSTSNCASESNITVFCRVRVIYTIGKRSVVLTPPKRDLRRVKS